MSDSIDFYEIRIGTRDDWDHVAMVKDEAGADEVMSCIKKENPENEYHIEHIEIVADVDMSVREY